VSDILDVKNCIDGVQLAMIDEDYEKAAGHVKRFLHIDKSVVEPASYEVLMAAEEKLFAKLQMKAKECAEQDNFAGLKRFCKLISATGHPVEGLTRFIEYLRKVLTKEANNDFQDIMASVAAAQTVDGSSGDETAYVALLQRLFGVVANLFQRYEKFVVENFGGPAAVLQLAQEMQNETESHATRIVRHFLKSRKISQLVNKLDLEAKQARASQRDPREVDGLLDELAIILGRCEQYNRFIKAKAKAALEGAKEEGSNRQRAASTAATTGLRPNTELQASIQEVIMMYIALETYFMTESVGKAVQIDEWGEGDLTSSMVEDVFFVLQKSALRAMATCSIHVVQAMIQQITQSLGGGYHAALMNFGERAAQKDVVRMMDDAKGFLTGHEHAKEKGPKSETNFEIIALNNAAVSGTYISKLKEAMERAFDDNFENDEDQRERVQPLFTELGDTASALNKIVEGGQDGLFSTVEPRIGAFVDSLQNVNFEVSEREQARNDAEDHFVQALITGLDETIKANQKVLTPNNAEAIIQRTLASVTSRFEQVTRQKRFNQLGGLQFDKDVRALREYFKQISTTAVRDKFTRLSQIASILSLERVEEIMLYWDDGGMTWRLSVEEVRSVLALRSDFSREEIGKLKLQ